MSDLYRAVRRAQRKALALANLPHVSHNEAKLLRRERKALVLAAKRAVGYAVSHHTTVREGAEHGRER